MEVYSIVRGNEINHAGKLMEPTLFYGKKKTDSKRSFYVIPLIYHKETKL